MMMKERPAQAPAEAVIGITTALLGVVTGVGAAFGLWSQLHQTAAPGILAIAVVTLCAGLALVGAALQGAATRLFLVVAACSLAIAFFAGSGTFSHLTS
jgi:hypothetical protein